MSEDRISICLSCDFGDIDVMQNNGYIDDEYIFCEKYNDVVHVRQECSHCETQFAEERKQKRLEKLIKNMADALEAENNRSNI